MLRCLLCCSLLALASCDPPAPSAGACDVTLTGAYPAEGFAANAAGELALLSRLNALNAPMRDAELDVAVTTDRATLERLFADGTPSLSSITAPAFRPVLDEAISAFLAAQGRAWAPVNPPMGAGGRFGAGASTWIFSERGVDLRQLVDKGLYGAAFYGEAMRRLPLATTPASIDQLVALYGATPAFPQNDTTAEGRDELAAKYAKRRTPAGDEGPYTRLRDAFVRARRASESPRCDAERVAALELVKAEWERVLASTVVFYALSAATKLQDPNAPLATRAGAMHDLGEGAAFLVGLRAVPQEDRRVTDAQLEQVLGALRMPSLRAATAHELLTVVPADVDGLLSAAERLEAAYGFTERDVARFKTSY
ncbi:MAG: hypothetical protein INH41_09825 [Myxococcaceae bacterium]|jgi:hypothetical protein|nr:hypothetical protein [Myxococcaceae bacterium]MCA3012683.1 hypothetical protein [Myxococcaceae bacterium]